MDVLVRVATVLDHPYAGDGHFSHRRSPFQSAGPRSGLAALRRPVLVSDDVIPLLVRVSLLDVHLDLRAKPRWPWLAAVEPGHSGPHGRSLRQVDDRGA